MNQSKLTKIGAYFINPNQITEIELQNEDAILYLSDGRTRTVAKSEIEEIMPDVEQSSGECLSGVPYPNE